MPKQLALISLICAFSQNVIAQTQDSVPGGSVDIIINEYYVPALGEESPLYNGIQYIEPPFSLNEGHIFFQSGEFKNGEIYFDGLIFREVPMTYDLLKDQVIIRSYNKVYSIVLPVNKIRQFTLYGHTFIRIENDDQNKLGTGFYDQLFKDKIGLFVKRQKRIVEKKGYTAIDVQVQNKNTYYVLKGGIYHNFRNKNGLLDILKDRRNEIVRHFKRNNIKFKVDPERAMTTAIAYYNQLMH